MKFDLVSGGISYAVFLVSVTAHEAAHAWAALHGGDATAYQGGQVSLDPTPHVRRSPFGMVVVPIATYLLNGQMLGWASTPYDPDWALRYPRRNALMALAGPAANLALLLAAAGGLLLGVKLGALEVMAHPTWNQLAGALQGGAWPCVAFVLSVVFSLNLLLLTFNLVPLPPLDGSALVVLALPEERARQYLGWVRQGGLRFIGLFAAWKLFDVIFPPLWKLGTALLLGTAH